MLCLVLGAAWVRWLWMSRRHVARCGQSATHNSRTAIQQGRKQFDTQEWKLDCLGWLWSWAQVRQQVGLQQTAEQQSNSTMGKGKDDAGKRSGCLAGGRKQGKAGGPGESVPLMVIGVLGRWLWGLVSVSVRSMTAHMAHTGHEQGTGHECGVRGVGRRRRV